MRRAAGLVLVFFLMSVCLAQAEIVNFNDDFSTTLMQDQATTTAVWDTLSGSIHLASAGLSPLGVLNTTGNSYATALSSNHIFLADGTGGLLSFLADEDETIVAIDSKMAAEQVRGIAIQGDWAYLAIGPDGIQSFNISDPVDMIAAGTADPSGTGFAMGIAVSGSHAYLANSGEGVAVMGIDVPSTPTFISNVATGNWTRGVSTHEGNLLVADGNGGMTVMSLNNPAAPTAIGSLVTGGNCYSVTAQGNHAFMADGSNGLVVVDISDPSDPLPIGYLNSTEDPSFTGTCRHVAATGDTIFVSSGTGGLYLVDITDPTSPTVIGRQDTDGEATQVTMTGTTAWLCDGAEGLATFTADPNILDLANNVAQSRDLSATGEPVSRAKISASFADSVKFELTCDGGTHWNEVYSGEDWHVFSTEGSDLRWRMSLHQESEEQFPLCDDLTITFERLHSHAEIISTSDIPGDEGGRIRVEFSASRFDAPDMDEVISEYSIYRRFDGSRESHQSQEKLYPPGSWDFIGSIPADQETEYATTVATLADSSSTGLHYTVLFIRARTTTIGVFYDSPLDSAYSVNNVQPAPPTSFTVNSYSNEGNFLSWDTSPAPDFAHFNIYRAVSPAILPQPSTLYYVTGETTFFDTTQDTWYYHLSVVDTHGHESEPVAASMASPVPDIPQSKLNISPNPFNPNTRIEFSVPEGGQDTKLEIYDFRGHLVRVLQDGFLPEGIYHRHWNGTDGSGRGMASGIYSCILKGSNGTKSIKMTLVR